MEGGLWKVSTLNHSFLKTLQNWNDGNGFSGWVQQIRDTTNFPKNG